MLCPPLTVFSQTVLQASADTIPALRQAGLQVGIPYGYLPGTDRCFAQVMLSDGQLAMLAYRTDPNSIPQTIIWVRLESVK